MVWTRRCTWGAVPTSFFSRPSHRRAGRSSSGTHRPRMCGHWPRSACRGGLAPGVPAAACRPRPDLSGGVRGQCSPEHIGGASAAWAMCTFACCGLYLPSCISKLRYSIHGLFDVHLNYICATYRIRVPACKAHVACYTAYVAHLYKKFIHGAIRFGYSDYTLSAMHGCLPASLQ